MIVGITGRAQHGKDSTGKILVEEFGFRRYAFADQLKSMALALDPLIPFESDHVRMSWLVEAAGGWDEAKKYPEIRRFLQVLGTEGVRDHLGEDSWVGALQKKMLNDGTLGTDSSYQPYPYVLPGVRAVVTDVRFPNEAAWIRRLGGKTWRVVRVVPAYESAGAGFVPFDNGLGADHPSERFVDDLPVDAEIAGYDLDSLAVNVRKEARKILADP